MDLKGGLSSLMMEGELIAVCAIMRKAGTKGHYVKGLISGGTVGDSRGRLRQTNDDRYKVKVQLISNCT